MLHSVWDRMDAEAGVTIPPREPAGASAEASTGADGVGPSAATAGVDAGADAGSTSASGEGKEDGTGGAEQRPSDLTFARSSESGVRSSTEDAQVTQKVGCMLVIVSLAKAVNLIPTIISTLALNPNIQLLPQP